VPGSRKDIDGVSLASHVVGSFFVDVQVLVFGTPARPVKVSGRIILLSIHRVENLSRTDARQEISIFLR
jgi:hypothetical protein